MSGDVSQLQGDTDLVTGPPSCEVPVQVTAGVRSDVNGTGSSYNESVAELMRMTSTITRKPLRRVKVRTLYQLRVFNLDLAKSYSVIRDTGNIVVGDIASALNETAEMIHLWSLIHGSAIVQWNPRYYSMQHPNEEALTQAWRYLIKDEYSPLREKYQIDDTFPTETLGEYVLHEEDILPPEQLVSNDSSDLVITILITAIVAVVICAGLVALFVMKCKSRRKALKNLSHIDDTYTADMYTVPPSPRTPGQGI